MSRDELHDAVRMLRALLRLGGKFALLPNQQFLVVGVRMQGRTRRRLAQLRPQIVRLLQLASQAEAERLEFNQPEEKPRATLVN